ncbi:hypothetical protein SAMN03159338_2113 [Sphingomonas sp. NFR04]|uniref:hypothetical protein n=1 Tax=Sphingomonas sp. NFR04 TaxID=1566283 RepID=UPI0008EF4FB6|nr:hypothetical protein [Sphingomonas sp. NFR04]SFJ66754.1 hypothetical protein SAMN03159338_2113 [Sphingomonas sp. NFR04]
MLPIGFGVLLIASPLQHVPATLAPRPCDVTAAKDIGTVQHVLSERLVDIFRRARDEGWQQDSTLKRLVDPNAAFDLGAGDVGRAMSVGTTGARNMSIAMPGTSFRYTRWTSIPMPADACAEQQVTVDFFDPATGDVARVEGSFRGGILLSAKGWMHAEVSGKR